MDTTSHPAYDKLVEKLYAHINEDDFSTAEQIADVVYEAATDGKDKLRYVAGADAQALNTQRIKAGDEAFRKEFAQLFFGS